MDLYERLVDLFSLGNIAQGTKEALATYIRRRDVPLPSEEQRRLSMTLSHLDQVREGFEITLRTSSVTTMEELHYLVNRVLLDWGWLKEQGLELLPGEEIHLPAKQTLAFAHAYITLAVLPRLPTQVVTFPNPPATYADIPVPHTPAQVLGRIDELEEVIWETTIKPEREMEPEPLRRTYGFFEASAWLVFHHLRLFLKG